MADARRFVELSVRVYRSLLRVYPRSFREQYGRDMTRVFGEALTDAARRQGVRGLVATWLSVLGDLLDSMCYEHSVELQRRWEMRTVPAWIAAPLAVLSVACFWILPFSPILAIAAVSTTRGSAGWSRRLAVTGAVLCTLATSLAAALLLWLLLIAAVNRSWAS